MTSTGPTPRSSHQIAYDSMRQTLVLFGGFDSTAQSDTWEFVANNWTRTATLGPSARTGFSLSYDVGRQKIVLFGGSSSQGSVGDTWEYSP